MAQGKVTSYLKRVLWEIGGKQCLHCNKQLSYRDIEIDHLIPQSFLSLPDWENILCPLEIKKDYDVNQVENLAISCRDCNRKKGSLLLAPSLISIYHKKTLAQKNKIEKLVKKYENENEKIVRSLQIEAFLEDGLLTEKELASVLHSKKIEKGTHNLSDNSIFGNLNLHEVSLREVEEIMNSEKILPDYLSDGMDLSHDDGSSINVKTLKQYEEAQSRGYYPLSNACMKSATVVFERPLTTLSYLSNATYADVSYIDDPFVGVADLHLLPIELLFSLGMDECDLKFYEKNSGKVFSDLVENGDLKIDQVTSRSLRVETDEYITYLFEIMRADFDNDGIQEMLVGYGGRVRHGTLAMGDVLCLKRDSENGIFYIMNPQQN